MQEAIFTAIAANVPVLVRGEPGTGKTSFFNALARASQAHIETVIAALRDPTDFGGMPIKTNDQEVYLAPPKWAKRLQQAVESGEQAWFFCDEISTAPPATQAALLRVIHEGVVGDLPLPAGVRRIAAMNEADQAAGGWDLAPPLANRFLHVNWRITAQAWADGMVQGFPDPVVPQLTESWENNIMKYRGLTSAFIRTRPELLQNCPKEESKAGGPWPSMRTWDLASRLLAAHEGLPYDEDIKTMLLSGTVGDGPAMEYLTWINNADLPDPETLLNDPDSYEVPERSDKIYAVLSSVVSAAIGAGPTPKTWIAAWKILDKTAKDQHADIAAAAAKTLAMHTSPKLPEYNAYVKGFVEMFREANIIPQKGQT